MLVKAYYITNRYKDAEKILKKIRKNGDEYPEIYGISGPHRVSPGRRERRPQGV